MSADISSNLETFFSTAENPILFTGAGVSARAGLPTWEDLIKKMADAMQAFDPLTTQMIKQALLDKELTNAVEYFNLSKKMLEGDKRALLKGLLSNYDATKIESIGKLPFSGCLTTNFDKSILDVIAKSKGRSASDYKYGDASFKQAQWDTNLFVARIHGAVENPSSIVLTEHQFDELLKDETYLQLLQNCFAHRNVLFLGFSFYDPAIKHVFHELDRLHGPATPGRHMAVVPSDIDSDFLRKAHRLNIEVVRYDSSDHHASLWNAITKFCLPISRSPAPDSRDPLTPAKSFLAACYARAKTDGHMRALREAVTEGIVAALLQDVAPSALSRTELLDRVRLSVGLKKADSEGFVDKSLRSLGESGLCRRMKSNGVTKFAWIGEVADTETLSADITYLSKCIVHRASVQEGWQVSSTVAEKITAVVDTLVRTRGWDLGAAFAAGRPPEPVTITSLLADRTFDFSGLDQERLSRILTLMIQSPTPEESRVLGDLGRASFAIEMAFQSPLTTLLHEATLPQRIYLDASVLLPALVEGHPYSKPYLQAITRLKETASAAAFDLRLRVSHPYLNEIISHRRYAESYHRELGVDFTEGAKRDALYHGASNTNVFVGAYACWLEKHGPIDFLEFLSRVAPYSTETELKKYLFRQGFEVIAPAKTVAYSKLYGALEREYSSLLAKGKTPLLIEHDALQLALLQEDIDAGRRAIFVSADRRLREIAGKVCSPEVANAMVSNVGLLQFIELMLGGLPEGSGITELLWSMRISDEATAVRSHYVNLALREYSDAMALALPNVVENCVQATTAALSRGGRSLDAEEPGARADAFKTLGGLEKDFFQKMDTEVSKLRDRLDE